MVNACLDGEEEGNAFAARQLHSDRGQVKGVRIALLQLHCAVGAHLKIRLNLHSQRDFTSITPNTEEANAKVGPPVMACPNQKVRNQRLDVPNNGILTVRLLDKT